MNIDDLKELYVKRLRADEQLVNYGCFESVLSNIRIFVYISKSLWIPFILGVLRFRNDRLPITTRLGQT